MIHEKNRIMNEIQQPNPDNNDTHLSLNELLVAYRKKRHLTTADIAQKMKIDEHHIIALEEGRYDDLPCATFTQGYARAYGRIAQIPKADLDQHIKRDTSSISAKSFFISGLPVKSRRLSLSMTFTSIFSVIIITIVILTGTWLYRDHMQHKNIIATNVNQSMIENTKGLKKSAHAEALMPSGSKGLANSATNRPNYPPRPVTKQPNS